jgi:hypothetical protein
MIVILTAIVWKVFVRHMKIKCKMIFISNKIKLKLLYCSSKTKNAKIKNSEFIEIDKIGYCDKQNIFYLYSFLDEIHEINLLQEKLYDFKLKKGCFVDLMNFQLKEICK